jgi:alpha-L-rhamnosidase
VAEWLYRYAAGIDEDAAEPAFQRVILHPQFDASLKEAKATYDSAFGPISSSWKDDGSTVTWTVAIPPNTTGLLYFPADATTRILEDGKDISQSAGISLVAHESGKAVYEAGSGLYSFTVQY